MVVSASEDCSCFLLPSFRARCVEDLCSVEHVFVHCYLAIEVLTSPCEPFRVGVAVVVVSVSVTAVGIEKILGVDVPDFFEVTRGGVPMVSVLFLCSCFVFILRSLFAPYCFSVPP